MLFSEFSRRVEEEIQNVARMTTREDYRRTPEEAIEIGTDNVRRLMMSFERDLVATMGSKVLSASNAMLSKFLSPRLGN